MKFDWKKFKNETFGGSLIKVSGIAIIAITILLIGFIAYKGLMLFIGNGQSVTDFLFSTDWYPDAEKNPKFGAAIFISGSIVVSILAVIISTPLAFCVAIYASEISNTIGLKIIKPFVEMLIGIPSVVYGWIGLSLVVPFMKDCFGGYGFSIMSGALVLALMIFPTITSITTQSLQNVPYSYKEASIALGATRWQTIKKILIPTAMPGILTGVVLGLARAFGEALAVQMVIGNTIALPKNLMMPGTTLTSIITMDMGNTVDGSEWNNALWSMSLVLLLISFFFIFVLKKIGRKELK